MTDTPDQTNPGPSDDDDDLLAAEYALDLLEGRERAEAAARVASDPEFARAVTAWDMRLSTLAEDLQPVPPDPATRQALFGRLFPDDAPSAPRSLGLRMWQGLAGLGAALAVAAGIAFVTLLVDQPATGPVYAAEIVSAEGDFRVAALIDKRTDTILLTRTAGGPPPGRILQVWAHGPGEPAQSVGLWPDGDTRRLPLPAEIAAVSGTLTIGVSEEPIGGSVTGSPSGRVFGTVDIPGVTPHP